MVKPVILTVDDDLAVLRAVERDLRRRFAPEYRVLRAESGEAALDAVRELRVRDVPVALTLADQRMPGMSGVELLTRLREQAPDAKRVLLTAYADTSAAIDAINAAQIDHYLMKPWDPPEERLYPVLEGLLEDWRAVWRPPFEGIRVLGDVWSPAAHEVSDFLSRNLVPFVFVDVATEPGQRLLADTGAQAADLPLVLFPDGTREAAPERRVLARHIGLRTEAERPFYDLVIVGGGPAGLAAGVYGASEGLQTVLVESQAPGGQAGTSSRIENYLGFPSGLSGAELTNRAVAQATRFGVELLTSRDVVGLRAEDDYRFVRLEDGTEVGCHAVLLATGVAWRRLDAPGVDRLTGAGIYYGSTMTEARAAAGETVYLVGAGNSAGQAALYFSQFAERVVILSRGESLARSMSRYLVDQIERIDRIEVRPCTVVAEAHGDTHLEALTLRGVADGGEQRVDARRLYLFIGAVPCTAWLSGAVRTDAHGFVLTGPDLLADGPRPWTSSAARHPDRDPSLLETSIPGVFAAGDVRRGSVKRVASSVGEGAIAVQLIHSYLARVGK